MILAILTKNTIIMRKYEISAIGLEQMSTKDFINTNGGSLAVFLASVIVSGLIYDIISNPQEVADAWNKGKEMVFK